MLPNFSNLPTELFVLQHPVLSLNASVIQQSVLPRHVLYATSELVCPKAACAAFRSICLQESVLLVRVCL
jgi:hypothetical protein